MCFFFWQVLGIWEASKKVWMTKLHAGPVLSGSVWVCLSMFIRNIQKEIKKDYLALYFPF